MAFRNAIERRYQVANAALITLVNFIVGFIILLISEQSKALDRVPVQV